jgi:hypothetical protein
MHLSRAVEPLCKPQLWLNGPWLAALETVKILAVPTMCVLNPSNSHFPYFHHSRGLAALRLVNTAIDTPELWVLRFSAVVRHLARRHGKGVQKEANIRTVSSPSFVASCLRNAIKREAPIVLATISSKKTQIRFPVLPRDIESLGDRI